MRRPEKRNKFDEERDVEWLVQQIPTVLDAYLKNNEVKIDVEMGKKLDKELGRARDEDHVRGRRDRGAVASRNV